MKTVDISETIAASDLKFGRIYEDMRVLNVLYESFRVQGNENLIT